MVIDGTPGGDLPADGPVAPHVSLGLSSRPVFQPGFNPDTMGSAYMSIQRDGERPQTYLDIMQDKKNMEEVSKLIRLCY